MGDKKIKFGVIGVGYLGEYHLKHLLDIKNIHVIGIYDTNKIRANNISKQYDVSNYKFPVLVREGGIIPMYPESYYDNNRIQQKPRDPLTLAIYPSKQKKTRFELFEDDGLTYRFKTNSMYNKTIIECDPTYRSDAVTIKIKGLRDGFNEK